MRGGGSGKGARHCRRPLFNGLFGRRLCNFGLFAAANRPSAPAVTRLRQSRRLTFVWLLLVAALMVRAAVPAGWMPSVDRGGVRIVLCTGYGPVTVVLDAAGHVHKDEPQHKAPHDPCPFGLAAAKALDLPPEIGLALPPAAIAALTGPALAAARFVAWRSLRPPARGPPLPA